MSSKSGFDSFPNELYLCIFDYLNPVDIIYSFSNLNKRINILLKNYPRFTCKHVDLTKLHPNVFKYYCLEKRINNDIYSIKLNDYQFKYLSFSSNNKLIKLNLLLENDYYIHSNEQFIFEYLQILTVQNHALTWQKPFIICQYLKQVQIHLKSHWDLVELLNSLPIVEKVDATIDYDVTSCRENGLLKKNSYSNNLIDFSYMIDTKNGLVYFVTDYSIIESLIQQFSNLLKLRLYIIGCINTKIDGSRLENNLFKYLPKLDKFDLFIQSYGGYEIKSMEKFRSFKWNFGSYTNQLTDMHFLFTLPFKFQRLDQCINEYFIYGIKTTFQIESIIEKSNNICENEKEFGMIYVKHVDLSCSITENLLNFMRKSFPSLESIRFSSSTAEYLFSKSLFCQSRYLINSIRTVIFDNSCQNQTGFIRLLPNLNKLIINQRLLNRLLEETNNDYIYKLSELHVYTFQRNYLHNIIDAFPNIYHLVLKTVLTNDEGPIRSYIDNRCHHKHRPVSVCDVLDELLKSKLVRLKKIEIGCYFERDEVNIEGILSRLISKYIPRYNQYHINAEDFKSTRCGSIQILFF
ncbi:unnamed protein product [Rotaria sordida]|uniref:F-box domain-containing protein n=1 Tax=Rotaria sordida TaxID=392033 RepID=A0A815IK64_9BILA|nr:unnamed protein product [Rotaria sordida]